MSKKSLYLAGKLVTGVETSYDTMGIEVTTLESTTTESATFEVELKAEECAHKLKVAPPHVTVFVEDTRAGVCGKMMEWLHQSIIRLCVSNQESLKTIGCGGGRNEIEC